MKTVTIAANREGTFLVEEDYTPADGEDLEEGLLREDGRVEVTDPPPTSWGHKTGPERVRSARFVDGELVGKWEYLD